MGHYQSCKSSPKYSLSQKSLNLEILAVYRAYCRIFSCDAIRWTRSSSSENQVSNPSEIRSYEFLEDFLQPKTSSIFKDSELEVATVHRQNTNGNVEM